MKIKYILFDFDGVILDSMQVRDLGFRSVLSQYPAEQVEDLITYHRKNGGLSRYVKFRYFYEHILKRSISNDEVNALAEEFSFIMKKELINPKYLIQDAVDFIKANHDKIIMHIVSGSDQEELRYLCRELKIDIYFKSINGSPTTKNDLVKILLEEYSYEKSAVVLIGDSLNDYEAAIKNNISFIGYNFPDIKNHIQKQVTALSTFQEFDEQFK